jgi:predicted DNA-binding protein (MmcQ/YjbR family)
MLPLEIRASVRQFALGLPGAWEDHPWGEDVVKVGKKIFVFLGTADGSDGQYPPGYNVKLTDPDQHSHALSLPGSELPGYNLGKHGWVSVQFAAEHTPVELLCDWVEESYRAVAPKKLIAELDTRG